MRPSGMIAQVSPREFAAWTACGSAGGQPLLLDVREPAEWQAATVRPAGCELLQVPMREVPSALHTLDPARPVAVLCHHGARSMAVAQWLLGQGFAEVANVAGGIDAWSRELDAAVPRY